MQKVELITVQGTFHGIDNHIDLVVGKLLGNKISFTDGTPVTLFQIRWSPRRVKLMDRDCPLLCVHTCAQHGSRTEDDTDVASVHGIHHRFLGFLILAFLNEAYFIGWNMIILYQLSLDFRIDVEVSAGLVSTQVRENKLCTFLCIVLSIIVIEHLGTVACLVVYMV